MYGKGDGQILLGGFFVKKGGYAKNPPDGAGEYPPIWPVSFLANKGIFGQKTLFLCIFGSFSSLFGRFLNRFD